MSQTKMNLSYIVQAINATQQLRSTVANVFTFLCDGFKADEDQDSDVESELMSGGISKDPKKFLLHFQNYLQAVNQDYNEVEKFCNLMSSNPELPTLGPSGSISQDSVADKAATYRNLSFAYQWHHRMHEYSAQTFALIQQNSIKKGQIVPGQLAKKRRPNVHRFVTPSSQVVDVTLQNLSNLLKDGSALKVVQMTGDIRVVQVTVGKVLNAFIVLRSFYLEKIMVKGQGEDFHNEDGTIDLFSVSQFESMRTITDHATSAMLECSSMHSTQSEIPLRYLLMWLQNYRNLFSEKCSVCGKHLFEGLPPLWRDVRNVSACHDACRG